MEPIYANQAEAAWTDIVLRYPNVADEIASTTEEVRDLAKECFKLGYLAALERRYDAIAS